ncbi:MAG: HD domain-containing protein [Sandaracinaceae bacterium]|nr:HD domain-containing protein [Sandaracinaceae bacterium]
MILRDPVHGLVAFEGDAERVTGPLMATREVQRLRRVRQLGLTSLVFPGAEHSRFAHALGAAHVMVKMQERLRAREGELEPGERLSPEHGREALAAALLHDLGHGPFSHLFEEVLPSARHHERWTVEMLLDEGTEVHAALARMGGDMPSRVASLLEGTHPLPWLARTVSGTLDVDRCDYLLRDSHMTGVAYGIYDLEWLLRARTFARTAGGEPVLAIEGRKGLPPIEGFFLARQFMYQQVYHHKATRAAEHLVRSTFRRVAELIREARAPERTPPSLRAAVLGEPIPLGDYLELDDSALMSCFAAWEQSPDRILADLSSRLRHRRLPKTIPLPEAEPALWELARARASEIVERMGMRSDLWVALDVASDVPYEEADAEPGGLWVSLRHQPLQRLGDASFLLRQLRNARIDRPRLVFPAEAREPVERALEEIIG